MAKKITARITPDDIYTVRVGNCNPLSSIDEIGDVDVSVPLNNKDVLHSFNGVWISGPIVIDGGTF